MATIRIKLHTTIMRLISAHNNLIGGNNHQQPSYEFVGGLWPGPFKAINEAPTGD